jgi:hypothetical protein
MRKLLSLEPGDSKCRAISAGRSRCSAQISSPADFMRLAQKKEWAAQQHRPTGLGSTLARASRLVFN